jgi:4-hydroxy-3-polyprenylbenzoate decarboxylase
MLAGRRFRYHKHYELDALMSADADFNIVGTMANDLKLEGPFGDHLGYYSRQHPFPYLKNVQAYHRDNAIWPITVVGRPPQEDSVFGSIIHELTESMVPVSIPGVRALHAVDEAGVHPLLLAVGSERYRPSTSDTQSIGPQEILTQSFAILGFNQASLAKYLCIMDDKTFDPKNVSDTKKFLTDLLERADFQRDLHFHTQATMDTLDYSGGEMHKGSKLVIAATGAPKRKLGYLENGIAKLAQAHPGVKNCKGVSPGILAVDISPYTEKADEKQKIQALLRAWETLDSFHFEKTALIVLTENADFMARSFSNFLWATFTRSNPASDLYGVHAETVDKHWGCKGPIVIDARHKPWIPAELSHPHDVVATAKEKLKKWL